MFLQFSNVRKLQQHWGDIGGTNVSCSFSNVRKLQQHWGANVLAVFEHGGAVGFRALGFRALGFRALGFRDRGLYW